jgi:hypothetical protein
MVECSPRTACVAIPPRSGCMEPINTRPYDEVHIPLSWKSEKSRVDMTEMEPGRDPGRVRRMRGGYAHLARTDLVARTAPLHYDDRLTHEKTAALGVSRVKVTRMLKEAREAATVRITVVIYMRPFAELEDRLVGASSVALTP